MKNVFCFLLFLLQHSYREASLVTSEMASLQRNNFYADFSKEEIVSLAGWEYLLPFVWHIRHLAKLCQVLQMSKRQWSHVCFSWSLL